MIIFLPEITPRTTHSQKLPHAQNHTFTLFPKLTITITSIITPKITRFRNHTWVGISAKVGWCWDWCWGLGWGWLELELALGSRLLDLSRLQELLPLAEGGGGGGFGLMPGLGGDWGCGCGWGRG